jgi:hypothetical protein
VHRIRVKVSGHAREYFPGHLLGEWVELREPRPVAGILADWGVAAQLVMAVFINGTKASLESVPPDGAEVLLMTPPAGG